MSDLMEASAPRRSIVRHALRVLGIVVVALLLGVVAAYPVSDWARATLTADERASLQAAGKTDTFVETSQGVMHVRLSGPESGPIVLLVHGSVVGGYGFQNWQQPLADAGYRVIVPDLLGYGYSDRPGVPYDRRFFMTQLSDLIAALRIDRPINIVGASYGGALVTEYVSEHPEDIASVALMSPAGLGHGAPIPAGLDTAVLGDWVFRVVAPTIVTNQMSAAYAGSPDRDAMIDWMGEQTRYRGFGDGLLKQVREHPEFEYLPQDYQAIGRSGVPVFAAWGTADPIHPYERTNLLREWVPQIELFTLPGASHAITYGRAADVLGAYLPFLSKARAAG